MSFGITFLFTLLITLVLFLMLEHERAKNRKLLATVAELEKELRAKRIKNKWLKSKAFTDKESAIE